MQNHETAADAANFAKRIVDDMKPLKKKKNPILAAILGFFGGSILLGIYFFSFKDFIILFFKICKNILQRLVMKF